jgi:hypothetical protein
MSLVERIQGGDVLKKKVDHYVDKCGQLENIREGIWNLKGVVEQDPDNARPFHLQAMYLLHRYYNMIVFAHYVRENAPKEYETSYSKWIETPEVKENINALGSVLRGGPVAMFEWN